MRGGHREERVEPFKTGETGIPSREKERLHELLEVMGLET